MGYRVTFDNGMSVDFQNKPSPDDLEEAFAHLTQQKNKNRHSVPAIEQMNAKQAATGAFGAAAGALAGAPFGPLPAAIGGVTGLLGGAQDQTKLEQEIEKNTNTGAPLSNPLMNVVGLAEQIPAGLQVTGQMLAGGLGGVLGALIPGDTAAAGFERSANAVAQATPFLTPKSDAGQAIAGHTGKLVEGYKEGVDSLAAKYEELRLTNPEAYAALNLAKPNMFFAGAKALPEALALAGLKGAKTKPAAPKSTTDPSQATKAMVDKAVEAKKQPDPTAGMTPSDKALLERLKGIDDILNKTESAEKGFQRKLRAENPPVVQGKETLYVDPQEQVFRGNPAEDNPRLALEKQTEAFDEAATRNEWGESAQGQPLPMLTREQYNASDVGPYATPEQRSIGKSAEEQVRSQADEHPFVKKAQERVDQATQLLLKAQDLFQNGKANAKQVARAEADLVEFERRLQKTRENVEEGQRRGTGVEPMRWGRGPGGKQRGAVDIGDFLRMFPDFKNSKMVDESGQLIKFYHGTSKDKDFGEVKPNTRGGWFTTRPEEASLYAKENDSKGPKYNRITGRYEYVNTADRVHEVYLNLQNPYKFTFADQIQMARAKNYVTYQRDLFNRLKREGYDGADLGGGIVVAFNPESIRSTISPQGAAKGMGNRKQRGAVNFDQRTADFTALADQQRNKPEFAMLAAQSVLGQYRSGNLYGQLLEHVGDLTHRMSEKTANGFYDKDPNFGKEYVAEKIRKTLAWINNPGERARMHEIPLIPELKAYAEAHKELPYYNRAQKLARDAAIALGEKRFNAAEQKLQALKKIVDSGMWKEVAGSHSWNKQRGSVNIDGFEAGWEKLFHGGKSFTKWDPTTVGDGEGMRALGPGLYTSDTKSHAELYTKYGNTLDLGPNGDLVVTPGVLSELAVNPKNIVDIRKGSPKIEAAIANLDKLGLRASSRGIISAMNHAQEWGRGQEARQAVVDAGIDGFKTELSGFGAEIAIFNPEIIAQVSRADTPFEPVPEQYQRQSKGMYSKQRGSVTLGPDEGPQAKLLSKIPGLGAFVPMQATPADVAKMAIGKPDLDRGIIDKFLIDPWTKGGRNFVEKTGNNPIMRFTMDTMIAADRAARGKVMQIVHDKYTTAARALSDVELTQVWNQLEYADLKQVELTYQQLREAGFNEKQVEFIQTHRLAMDEAFKSINEAALAAGKDPIDKRVGYAAMRSTGDFRRLVYERLENGEQGSVVGVIGSDFRFRVKQLADKVDKEKYIVGNETYFGGLPKHKGSAHQAVMQALDVLAKNDPRVKEFLSIMDDIYKQEAWQFLNAKKHTMPKKGIYGMEGRSPDWMRSAVANAKDGIRSQALYLESMLAWGELSKGVKEVREVLSNKDIDMPNAKQWSEDFLMHSLGFNPNELGRGIETGIANVFFKPLGIGYAKARETMDITKKITNTALLAIDPIFMATNVIQPFRAMPGMKAFLKSRGVENLTFDVGTGYYYIGDASITAWKMLTNPEKLTSWERSLYDYARDNHVFGSDLVEHSNRTRPDTLYKLDKLGNTGLGSIESVTRELTFVAIAKMLYDGGMRPKDGLFQTAHNLTDSAMNSYAPIDRPNAYNAMGPVGGMSANLMSYKHNEVSRVMMYARELTSRKDGRPLAVELATSVATAGVLGTLAFDEADQLFRFITKQLGNPMSLSELVIRLSEEIPHAPYVLSHGMGSLLGVDLSKRLGLQNTVANSLGEAFFSGGSKIGEILGRTWDVTKDPSELNFKKLGIELAPRPFAMKMEDKWFSKTNAKGEQFGVGLDYPHKAGPVRTETDKTARSFGLLGINESVKKQKLWDVEWKRQAYAERRLSVLKKVSDELLDDGEVSKMSIQKYLANEGDQNTLFTDIQRIMKAQNIPQDRAALLKAAMSKSITQLQHAKRLKEVNE